jgi:hypothetical protein
MVMKIEVSTDWQEIHRKLRLEMNAVGYNADLDRMLSNIDKMVSDLSKIEVEARRTRSTVLYREKLEAINNAIDRLEKLIIMAKLMR